MGIWTFSGGAGNPFGATAQLWAGVIHTDNTSAITSVSTFVDTLSIVGHGWAKTAGGIYASTWGQNNIPKGLIVNMGCDYLASQGGNGIWISTFGFSGFPGYQFILTISLVSNSAGNLIYQPQYIGLGMDFPFFIVYYP